MSAASSTRFAPLALVGALLACGGPGFDKPMRFGERVVQPDTLNRGRDLFNRFCATCHGYDGKAETSQARQLDPRPRDLTRAEFKRVASPGALPTDSELSTIIHNGVPGTGMPAWPQLQGDDLDSVVQYLKTFSQRWSSDATPAPKKSERGSMYVLPGGNDAASFRAASRAVGIGHGGSEAFSLPRLDVADVTVDDGAIAARTPSVQVPQVSF